MVCERVVETKQCMMDSHGVTVWLMWPCCVTDMLGTEHIQ